MYIFLIICNAKKRHIYIQRKKKKLVCASKIITFALNKSKHIIKVYIDFLLRKNIILNAYGITFFPKKRKNNKKKEITCLRIKQYK